jgi:LmbE family N-acetylglucosaminyl deacetylase
MRILYVFPHPDDESFGPARGISVQVSAGHEVSLLTLTKGGATKERFRLGYSVGEMGEARRREMDDVAKVLGLADLTVLDFPDSGLKELDPRELERAVAVHLARVRPAVVATYPVHGISGFHDHLVCHATVKRVFVEMRDGGAQYLRRLAFFTLTEEQAARASGEHRLSGSTAEEVDCVVEATEEDMDRFRHALDCYVTYREAIRRTGIREMKDPRVAYEFFGEGLDPPVDDVCAGLIPT